MAETPVTGTRPGLKAAMVPLSAADIDGPSFLRMMVLGFSKAGKSTQVVSTAPGPVYVINSDQKEALVPVTRFCSDFLHNHVISSQAMNEAIELARQLVKEGKVQTVVWDTISGFSPYLEAEAFASTLTKDGKEDGRKAWPVYRKIIRSTLSRLFKLKAHVIVISHYLDVGGAPDEESKGVAKTGQGIVPMLGGASRAEVGGMFQDVVFMEKQLTGPGKEERFFVTGIDGVYGPGCRSVNGNRVMPADVGVFLKAMEADMAARKPKSASVKPPVNGAARPAAR